MVTAISNSEVSHQAPVAEAPAGRHRDDLESEIADLSSCILAAKEELAVRMRQLDELAVGNADPAPARIASAPSSAGSWSRSGSRGQCDFGLALTAFAARIF